VRHWHIDCTSGHIVSNHVYESNSHVGGNSENVFTNHVYGFRRHTDCDSKYIVTNHVHQNTLSRNTHTRSVTNCVYVSRSEACTRGTPSGQVFRELYVYKRHTRSALQWFSYTSQLLKTLQGVAVWCSAVQWSRMYQSTT